VEPGHISCKTWTKSEYYTHSYKFTLSTSAKAFNLTLGLVSYPELWAHSILVPKRVCGVVGDISCHMAGVEPYFVKNVTLKSIHMDYTAPFTRWLQSLLGQVKTGCETSF